MFSFLTSSIVRYFNSVVLFSIVVGLSIFSFLIGTYNYDMSMKDLVSKSAHTTDLASIGLSEPIWNFDTQSIDNIFTAIFLDNDVVAIRIMKSGESKSMSEKKRDEVSKVEFSKLLDDPLYINNKTSIKHSGKDIAEVQIVTTTQRVKNQIEITTLMIVGFALTFVIALSTFIWNLGVRIVQRPINALRASADSLAAGHLNQEINTSRRDELGSLAVSFDTMRNAIRKKLADLAILNETAEKLAGIHDQTTALETVIKVMNDQTHVERGSIYLLDKNQLLVPSAFYPHFSSDQTHSAKNFSLGEGIVGKVAKSGKIEFIKDVSQTDNYIDASPAEQPKALLCVPLMDDKDVFGVMNFVGKVGTVNFDEDDEGFTLTVARMVVTTIKNIQMMAVIEEQNRTLEERILERTAQLRQKTNDVNNMLQNMRQGIFTIIAGGLIHNEHSAFLCDIFERKDIADTHVYPFLFDNSDVGSDVLDQVSAALDSMIGEDAMMFEFNNHLLVREYTKKFDDGRSKMLELEWNPVLDANDQIDKLMVTVRDVTELKALQAETEKQKEELAIIGQILAVSGEKLQKFIATSNAFFEENKKLISQNTHTDLSVVATLFRNMHTIKGNARTYGLSYITDSVHNAESTYDKLRSNPDEKWDQQQLLSELELARACVARYETIYNEKLAGFGNKGASIDGSVLDDILQAVSGVDDMSSTVALQQSLLTVKSTIALAKSDSVEEVVKDIVSGLSSLATQLDKQTPVVNMNANNVRLRQNISPIIANVFMHLFRNSLDHGIESSELRLALAKSGAGTINLDVSLNQQSVVFEFSDDGRGLALEDIKTKAIELGKISADQPMTDEQIAHLIFLPGLSTAKSLTSVSGRGVGMDAIKQFLQKIDGDIDLAFTAEAAGSYRQFKLIITLPAKFALIDNKKMQQATLNAEYGG